MNRQLLSILERCQDYPSLESQSSLNNNEHDPYEIVFGENKEVICELVGQANENLDTVQRTFRPNATMMRLLQEQEIKAPAEAPVEAPKPQVAVTVEVAAKKENQNEKFIGLVEYFIKKCI